MRRILFGPPGTGKTTSLIREVELYLKAGIAPARIGFVSFSRRAIQEAKDAAARVTRAELPYFRTIHSTAYHLLGLERGDVFQHEHLQDFGKLSGISFRGGRGDVQDLWEGGTGDRILALHGLAHARCTSLETEWRRAMLPDLPWSLVARVVKLYERFKSNAGLWDFNDMIAQAEGALPLDVLFIDEAQDTSAAQWKLLRKIASHVEHVFMAGDDDQAIYQWGGAEPEQLLRFRGERVVLPQSYRLPRRVKAVADRVAARITQRVFKHFSPRDEEGEVTWVPDAAMVDLHREGTWLLLARTNAQLRGLRELAQQQGVVYSLPDGRWSWTLPAVTAALAYERLRKGLKVPRADARHILGHLTTRRGLATGAELGWEDVMPDGASRDRTWMDALEMPAKDVAYIRALRRSGESLKDAGRVRIGTVHSVKGAQADHVLLLTDLSERIERSRLVDPDAELRVQYVGVTRSYRTLTLVDPNTRYSWNF